MGAQLVARPNRLWLGVTDQLAVFEAGRDSLAGQAAAVEAGRALPARNAAVEASRGRVGRVLARAGERRECQEKAGHACRDGGAAEAWRAHPGCSSSVGSAPLKAITQFSAPSL